ncbi:ATP-dependent protease La [Cokeromyces recurvatus]|uniref:ATP-dependent protease La n=1 Tax=Cokeromyces recurvatus TaxID=90255 RepID=UPI00221F1007|nr:ATP-dependent protease La [Cokeromyces recurvatus]KAI7905367.1 ATP-dependent protease La [Cokeromyces recurvatus]
MYDYPEKLIVVPLHNNEILLPAITLRLLIRGKQAAELTKAYFKQHSSSIQQDIYVACIPLRQGEENHDDDDDDAIVSQAPQVPLPSNMSIADSNNLVSIRDRYRLIGFGCLARIVRVQRSGTNLFGVFVEGICRFKLDRFTQNTPSMPFANYWTVHVLHYDYPSTATTLFNRKFINLTESLIEIMKQHRISSDLLEQLIKIRGSHSVSDFADFLTSIIDTSYEERLKMLETHDITTRLEMICGYLMRQLSVLKISGALGGALEGKLTRHQREFYLRQQLEALQEDRTNSHNDNDDDNIAVLNQRLVKANLPEHAIRIAQRELKRLKKMQLTNSEWAVGYNYLTWLADLPWCRSSALIVDVDRSRRQLDADHFGLQKIKKRIIEYISVLKTKKDLKAPILCLVGPPGVGKTSLGKSIAQSMQRKFHRISLGGIRDEAEIRGHRRTYVGAMPGLIIQALCKCQVNNPLLLLDEIDKLVHHSQHGNPAAALLEVLDPEQNSTFNDHYLNVAFDLSQVLFVATANNLDTIPAPLLDRMEVIELEGYTIEEKLDITKRHLAPKQIQYHGMRLDQVIINDQAILFIIERYTRESGVRELERQLGATVRAKCVQFTTSQQQYEPNVEVKHIESILGNTKFEKEVTEREAYAGVVIGLAYMNQGNSSILFVEATKMPGNGQLHLTGSLGTVIQESAQLALSWVKSNAYTLGLVSHSKEKMVENDDIHIHFPSGSIPKDGPSAGITLVCALISLYSNKPVPITTAMTGEISLRGQVLPVGGVKSKVLAAHRAGIRRIILPFKNKRDIEDVPNIIRDQIEFCYVKTIWHVLSFVFNNKQQIRMDESHL